MDRYMPNSRCPVCDGHTRLPPGKGVRCAGFRAGDKAWCTREEHAGSLPRDESTQPPAYRHELDGPCGCGKSHGAGPPPRPRRRGESTAPSRPPDYEFEYREVDGTLAAIKGRCDAKSAGGRKTFAWRLPDGDFKKGLNDRPMSVRTALQLINKHLDEILSDTEGDYDADTRWALTWFETCGLKEGPYGAAETLSTRYAVAVDGLRRAGIVESGGGKVRLLSRDELPKDWDPRTDTRLSTWEVTQHLVRALLNDGEDAAAAILAAAGSAADPCRDLAYRLFHLCERKGWAQEAGPYNALAVAWPRLVQIAASLPGAPQQVQLV